MAGEKKFYSLKELAESGLLFWSDIKTVQQKVDMYEDVFKPLKRGEGKAKRYVITHENVLKFLELEKTGALKGYRLIETKREEAYSRFLSILAVGTHRARAKKLRDELELLGFRVDYLAADTRREFMSVLYGTTKTHATLVLVVDVKNGDMVFSEGTPISSAEIRRMGTHGTTEKVLVIWSEGELNQRSIKAFKEKGGTKEVVQVVNTGSGKKALNEVVRVLVERKGKIAPGDIRRILKRPSSLKGRK